MFLPVIKTFITEVTFFLLSNLIRSIPPVLSSLASSPMFHTPEKRKRELKTCSIHSSSVIRVQFQKTNGNLNPKP
jgi:hypothetical protein